MSNYVVADNCFFMNFSFYIYSEPASFTLIMLFFGLPLMDMLVHLIGWDIDVCSAYCCRWFSTSWCENASWSVTSCSMMIPWSRCSQCSFWIKYSLFAINFVVWVSCCCCCCCCLIVDTRETRVTVRAVAVMFILIFNVNAVLTSVFQHGFC